VSEARVEQRTVQIEVEGGSIPTVVQGPRDPGGVPAVVVVPSVFGPAPDLLERLGELGDAALVCVPDPFWRTGEGALAYDDMDAVVARFGDFDIQRCRAEMGAVAAWARASANGRVIGVGICFGGPYVLRMAADGELDGVVTWHGSRMEQVLGRAGSISCPVRHHLGGADAITPPEVVDALRAAFAEHADAQIVVHDGADHGFSHDGPTWDADVFELAFGSLVELVERSG
jgi:carboxymethylenebutenolidase